MAKRLLWISLALACLGTAVGCGGSSSGGGAVGTVTVSGASS